MKLGPNQVNVIHPDSKWWQALTEALIEIGWNSCIRERINGENCIESDVQKKCGFCILHQKGIL